MAAMDIAIPTFARLRYGTVIVRLKMESSSCNCQHSVHPGKNFSRVVHRVARCEQCSRTRIVSQYSDCDSDLVGTCRPYRTREAKSRYVNVCAAVCLLLLVGGLTPSSAAPHRTRRMDKRQTEQENETWSNPCDFNKSHINSQLKYKSQLAADVALQSRDTINRMMGYKDDIAELHSYNKFEDMLDIWSGTNWLRVYNDSWLEKHAFPDNKTLGKPLEMDELKALVEDTTKVDSLLPVISKALKMVGAGLQAVSEPDKKWMPDGLRNNLTMASKDVRQVLCYVSEVTRARNQAMLPLYNKEIPKYTEEREAVRDAFLIYRDTINLLEYVEQLFTAMSQTNIYEMN